MMQVVPFSKKDCDEWVTKKHYSHRASIYWAGFALVDYGVVEGVCVFGQPSPPLQKHAFSDRDFKFYELTRVVVQTDRKNAASFLVGNALNMLPKPCAVVSFADSEMNHCGFLYQATNWTYTGATVSHDHMYLVDGKRVHPMSLRDRGITNPKEWAKDNGVQTVKPSPKHRYFFICGNKRDKKTITRKLKYPEVKPYPKIDPIRYDDGPHVTSVF